VIGRKAWDNASQWWARPSDERTGIFPRTHNIPQIMDSRAVPPDL